MIRRMLGVSLAALTLTAAAAAQESKTGGAATSSREPRSNAGTPDDFAQWAQQRLETRKAEQAKRLEVLEVKQAETTGDPATKTDEPVTRVLDEGPEEGTYQRFAVRQREYMHARREEKAEEQQARMQELERLHQERNQKAKEQPTTEVRTEGEAAKTPAEEPKVISRHKVKASQPPETSEPDPKPQD